MLAGVTLLLIALALRTATVNRYVRNRLLISSLLFGAYTLAAALVASGRLPGAVSEQIRTASPLLLAFGIANAIVVLVINPWRIDRIPERFPNIVQDTIVIGLFGVAAMLFLPDKIVATTAVGAVVIGFALQDTLGNLFAGLAIQIEKPFRVGHWVTIGGKDGLVSEITWRATKIRTKAGNFVVVPNSVLSRDTITNYSEPTRETRLEVQVEVGYDVPTNHVKAVIMTALRGEPLITASPEPEVLAFEFGQYAIVYHVRVWTTDFATDERVRDHVRTRIYYAFRRNDIPFPYPVQVQIKPDATTATAHATTGAAAEAVRTRSLDGVEILASLTPEQRAHLTAAARPLLYAAGETIAREGEAGASMFVVVSGEASVTLSEAGGEVARLKAGAVFGEMSLLTGHARSATVSAASDCELLEIGADPFRRVVLADAAIVEQIAAAVATRRAELERHRETRALDSAPDETPHTFLARVRQFLQL